MGMNSLRIVVAYGRFWRQRIVGASQMAVVPLKKGREATPPGRSTPRRRLSMLSVLQHTIADIRPFIGAARLPILDFPAPNLDLNFIRGFGCFRDRRLGGTSRLGGEGYFCRCASGVRFTGDLHWIGKDGERRTPYCAFRRLFIHGGTVVRAEVGLGEGGRLTSNDQCGELLRAYLATPVRITKVGAPQPWGQAANTLAECYTRATSPHGKAPSPPLRGALVCRPLILLEYRRGQIRKLPKEYLEVSDPRASAEHVDLGWCRVNCAHKATADVYFVGVGGFANKVHVRNLRINLLRLYAERECLNAVLRAVATSTIAVNRATVESDCLQLYLQRSIKYLERVGKRNDALTDMYNLAQSATDLVHPADRTALLDRLQLVRRQLFARVETFTASRVIVMGDVFSNISNSTIVNRSTIENSLSAIRERGAVAHEAAFQQLVEAVLKSSDIRSGQLLVQFGKEIQSPQPQKSALQAIWHGILGTLPPLAQAAGLAVGIQKLIEAVGQ